jgi:protein-disulfide isomerase
MLVTRTQAAGLSLVLLFMACSSAAQPTEPAASQGPAPASSDVVATVGSMSILLSEVDEKALKERTSSFGAMRLVHALYEARRAVLDEMIMNALIEQEAKARGLTIDALVSQEISAKTPAVSDAEVAEWYKNNPDRVQGAQLDEIRGPIKAMLSGERFDQTQQSYVDTLKAKTPVKITLEPPRENVAEAGRPALGPPNAPVTMIEFSDFQCPFCLRAFPTLMKVLSTYGNQIRLVYRHYPLKNHPQARPAAEASQCVHEQGKFWQYHNLLFGKPNQLSDAELKQAAVSVGVEPSAFDACMASHKYAADVDADIAAGDEAGVSGTPAFFINGRILSGALPFEAFKKVIDEELARR